MAKNQRTWTVKELNVIRTCLKSNARNKIRFAADYLDRSYSATKQFIIRARRNGILCD